MRGVSPTKLVCFHYKTQLGLRSASGSEESMTKASHRLTVCQADHEALGDLLLRSLQAVHCKYGRGQVNTEGALALQVEALHCAVGAAHQEACVAARNPQRQSLQK